MASSSMNPPPAVHAPAPSGPAVPVPASNVALQNAVDLQQQGLLLQQLLEGQRMAWRMGYFVALLLLCWWAWPVLVYMATNIFVARSWMPWAPMSPHQELWLKYGVRNELIEYYTKDRVHECEQNRAAYLKETERMTGELSVALVQNGGFEDGKDPEEGKRLWKMKAVLDQRLKHNDRMEARMSQLESMADDNGVMKECTMKSEFDFKRVLYAHDMCKDRNECFCDILLAPQQDLAAKLAKNQKEIDALEKERKEKKEM